MPETETPKRVAPMLDGYDTLKITLPNGRAVVGKVLPLVRASHYLRLITQRDAGSPEVRDQLGEQILAEFPKEVGLERELNELTLPEFWEAFSCFFDRRVSPAETNGTPSPTLIGATS